MRFDASPLLLHPPSSLPRGESEGEGEEEERAGRFCPLLTVAKREKARHRGDKRHRRGILSVGSASWPPSSPPPPPAFNGHSLARDRCTVKTENIFPTRGGEGEDRGWTGSAFDRRAISAPKGFRRESVFFRKSQGLTIPLLLGNSVFPRLRVFLLGVVRRR